MHGYAAGDIDNGDAQIADYWKKKMRKLLSDIVGLCYWPVVWFLALVVLISETEAQTVINGQVITGGIVVSTPQTTITNCVISNPEFWAVYSTLPGAQITLQNCLLVGSGACIYRAASVTIQNCHVEAQGKPGIVVENDGNTNEYVMIANTDISDAWTAIQLLGLQGDPNVYLLSDRVTQTAAYQHNDQISIINSSGTAQHLIEINHCLIACDSDAPQFPTSAAIQAGDYSTSYVSVVNCTILNGQSTGLCGYYANGNTSIFTGNTIVGIGSNIGSSYGLWVTPGAAIAYNNTVTWFDPSSGGINTITLAQEEQLALAWEQDMAGQQVGCLYQPVMQLPRGLQ